MTRTSYNHTETPVLPPPAREDWGVELPERDRFLTLISEADAYARSHFSEPVEFTEEEEYLDQVDKSRPRWDRELQVMFSMLHALRRVARTKGTDYVLARLEGFSPDLVDDICTDLSEYADPVVAHRTLSRRGRRPPKEDMTIFDWRDIYPGLYIELRPIRREEVESAVQRVRLMEERYAQAVFLQPHLVNTGTRGPDALRKALWLYWPIDADIDMEIYRQRILSVERRNWISSRGYYEEQGLSTGTFEEWMERTLGEESNFHWGGGSSLEYQSFGPTFLTRWVLSYLKYMNLNVPSISQSRMTSIDRLGGDERLLTPRQIRAWSDLLEVGTNYPEMIFWLRNVDPPVVRELERKYDLNVLIDGIIERYPEYEEQNGDNSDGPWEFVREHLLSIYYSVRNEDLPKAGSYASRADLQRVLRERPLADIFALARQLPRLHSMILYFNMGYLDIEFFCNWNEKPTIDDVCWRCGLKRHEYYRILAEVITFFSSPAPRYVQGTFGDMSSVSSEIQALEIGQMRSQMGSGKTVVDRNCGYHDIGMYRTECARIRECIADMDEDEFYARAINLNNIELSVLLFLRGEFSMEILKSGFNLDLEGVCLFLKMTEFQFGDALHWYYSNLRRYFDLKHPAGAITNIAFTRLLPRYADMDALREREREGRKHRPKVVRKPRKSFAEEAEEEDGDWIPF